MDTDWATHMADPFAILYETSQHGAALAWMQERNLLMPIPLVHRAREPVAFSVRVIGDFEIEMLGEDRALLQLLYAARQRLTARLSEVSTFGWPSLMTPRENPFAPPVETNDLWFLYEELALLHAQLRLLTASWPKLGVYNQAWDLFAYDMQQYAPWMSLNNDSSSWCALVHRQMGLLVDYASLRAEYREADARWPKRARAAA